MFQDHSALAVRPAAANGAVIFRGSSPRRVAFHVTDSMPMPDSASARSTTEGRRRWSALVEQRLDRRQPRRRPFLLARRIRHRIKTR